MVVDSNNVTYRLHVKDMTRRRKFGNGTIRETLMYNQ